jgi:hypothetical protein
MRKCIKTRPDVEKYLFYGFDSGGLETHRNRFLTAPDVKKYIFKALILFVWKCIKTRV